MLQAHTRSLCRRYVAKAVELTGTSGVSFNLGQITVN